jgi:hypothetical protein
MAAGSSFVRMAAMRLRVKIGEIEFEYEGEEAFLEERLPGFLEALRSSLPAEGRKEAPAEAPASGEAAPPGLAMTTRQVARRIEAKTGPEVAKSAAAHLALFAGRASFTRRELLREMQAATGHYKASMSGNLTKILAGLIAEGFLVETGAEQYALSARGEREMRAQLGAGEGGG